MLTMSHQEQSSHYEVLVGEKGRIVLPAAIRERLAVKPGDRLMLVSEPSGEVRLISRLRRVQQLRGMFAGAEPAETVWSEELMRERREEARRESPGEEKSS